MLTPERLMPGTRATTWAMPMPELRRKSASPSRAAGSPSDRQPENRRADTKHERHEGRRPDRRLESVVQERATITAGIVATTMSQAILRSRSRANERSGWLPGRPG